MGIDNELYTRLAATWWHEDGVLHLLHALNPVRVAYFRQILTARKIDPRGKRALDVGCGGGLLAEEVARLGCRVTGIDPSAASILVARTHAAQKGHDITYRVAPGEAIPYPAGTFDLVYCCDVLEHVDDLDAVVADTARVLKPGGIYFYDTINRNFASKIIAIRLLQDAQWLSCLPPRLHEWQRFIKPAELHKILAQHSIVSGGIAGLVPDANPITLVQALRRRKRGEISYAELGRRLRLRPSRWTLGAYMGFGVKRGEAG
jgi:2-polyprenyl-6-hydroxyphenyl methylase/3-demethylubiquinone-9 3-methyltransferase